MKRTVSTLATTAVAWVSLVSPASAHHSAAMFDRDRTVTLRGVIRKWEWTNPHAWVWVDVPKAGGGTQAWGLELAALSMLRRGGFTKDTFKAGEKVMMLIHPEKDGSPGGQFLKATFADGRTLVDPAAPTSNVLPVTAGTSGG